MLVIFLFFFLSIMNDMMAFAQKQMVYKSIDYICLLRILFVLIKKMRNALLLDLLPAFSFECKALKGRHHILIYSKIVLKEIKNVAKPNGLMQKTDRIRIEKERKKTKTISVTIDFDLSIC